MNPVSAGSNASGDKIRVRVRVRVRVDRVRVTDRARVRICNLGTSNVRGVLSQVAKPAQEQAWRFG